MEESGPIKSLALLNNLGLPVVRLVTRELVIDCQCRENLKSYIEQYRLSEIGNGFPESVGPFE